MAITSVLSQEIKTNEGCDVAQGLDYSVVKQGVASVLSWVVSHPQTLEAVTLEDAAKVIVNLRTTSESPVNIERVIGVIPDATGSVFNFTLPEPIYKRAGVYSIDAGLFTQNLGDDISSYKNISPAAIQSGYVLVERTSFTTTDYAHSSVPRVEEIRNLILDFPATNTLLQQVEFSNSDIINAIMQPVLEWNETPPYLHRYSFDCCNFPFRFEWMHATIAYLLKTAIHKYMRNKLQTNHAGMGGDDLNRNGEYSSLQAQLSQQWQQWLHQAKFSLNINQFVGSMNSSIYSHFPGDRVVTHPRTI